MVQVRSSSLLVVLVMLFTYVHAVSYSSRGGKHHPAAAGASSQQQPGWEETLNLTADVISELGPESPLATRLKIIKELTNVVR